MCPSRDPPPCVPASRRYRTHDGTCNNRKRPRWGSAQMPFHRFLAPEYADGVEGIRRSITNTQLPSARFVSLVVHGTRQEEAPVTMMLALWGQLLDHDLTATAQPRSLNGSTPRCCGKSESELHPSCLPIKVPLDDPWLSPLGVRCLEFLRSAPAQRRDCLLSWREQTNQVTSYIDASPIYSSNPRTSDNARIFRSGMLLFGRGPPSEDVCFRAALANQCIRPGDARSGEQPGLLMLHMVWVNEHNQIATRLSDINPHWSDEKLYQETRRIIGAMFQHVTYREFLPIILGKEVSRLFNLDLETSGFYKGYDPAVNPTVANEFSAAAFRFGHSLIQGSYMRADRHHRFIPNNVTLHEETADGDLGGPGSLHRLVRGMVNQRALKRDEFITAELTNHLFQTRSFPFGLDLAAINIQRGRDHGIQPYVNWRIPCGLTPIKDWDDLDRVSGPASAHRLRKAYRSVDDIDLFVGGLAERPVVGGIVGPTFSCIIAQQFSNLRKGDRFWYENGGFESSFTPAQLESIRQVAFSQVLCRALGGGTLQPHVFLPADGGQNERLPCDSKLMAPIDLEPWTERDPFTRPSDEPGQSDNLIDLDALQAVLTSTTTTRRPQPTKAANVINKVDFIPNGHTGLQIPSNGQIVLNSPRPQTTVVNNKLDLNLGTQPTPARPVTQNNNNPTTAIDNKLDLTGTTAPPPKRKPTRKTTPKRRPTPSSNLVVNNLDFKRDSLTNTTTTGDETVRQRRDVTFINLSKLFTKEDDATLPKKPHSNHALRRGYYPAAPPPDPPSDYDDVNNYDYGDGPVYVKPGYGYGPPETEAPPPNPYYYPPATEEPPPQPPYCGYNCYQPPMTTYNPYGLDTRKPARTTPKRGQQPNKIITPNNDYDPQKRRTTPRPAQQQQPQQQRTTTQRTVVLRPGLVVINDNRPTTLNNQNNRPVDKPIFLSPSSSSSSSSNSLNSFPQNSKNPSPSAASQSVFSVDPRPQFSSRPQPPQQSIPSPIFSQKKPNLKKPPKELRQTDSLSLPTRLASKQDYDYDSLLTLPDDADEHDGYLRPEQNAYEPLKKTPDLETYRNYSAYNDRQTAAPSYYHVPTGRVLWTTDELGQLGRYAERYQAHETDQDQRDQFVGPYIDQMSSRTVTTEQNEPKDGPVLTEDVGRTEQGKPTNKLSTKIDLTDDAIHLTGNGPSDSLKFTDDDSLDLTDVGPNETLDLTDAGPSDTSKLTDDGRSDTVDLTDDKTSNSLKLTDDGPSDALDLTDVRPYETLDLTKAEPSDTLDLTDTGPSDTSKLTNDVPSDTLNLTDDGTSDKFDLTDDGPSDSFKMTGDGPSDPLDLTNDRPSETLNLTEDRTSEASKLTQDGLSETLDLPDQTHARTANKDSIQSILDDHDSNEIPKLPRFDQQDPTDGPSTPTSTIATPPRRNNPTSRKRRPTRPGKRPTTSTTLTSDRRQKPGIALVPFVLLTSIERPDNWVMFNVAKSKKRNPLPEVPQLKSDVFALGELPKPIAEED